MNWYNVVKMGAYANEVRYLHDYLKGGFDPYDFQHILPEHLERNEELTPEMSELHEDDPGALMEHWTANATPEQIAEFKEFALNHPSNEQNPYDSPPYLHMNDEGMLPARWMVHFTDNADSIESKGFQYGHDDMRGLHLTTYKRDEMRRKYPGYNFAFDATDSRNIQSRARNGGYGSEAVVFWASAVKVYHYGDEERQMIFWGKSVNPSTIYRITKDENGLWHVPNGTNERVKRSEDIMECVDWVINHQQLIDQQRSKEQRQRDTRMKRR